MTWALAADAVVVVHLLFLLFVVLGGLGALRWPRLAWLHLPALAWGSWVELTGRVCPLTPLEIRFRAAAGQAGYDGGFIDHYLVPVLYPPGLTRTHQIVLGVALLGVNLAVYGLWARRRIRDRRRNLSAAEGIEEGAGNGDHEPERER